MNGQLPTNKIPVLIEFPTDYQPNEPSALVTELKTLIDEQRRRLEAMHESAVPISMTEAQLADYFGISKLTMERIRRDGKISYTRVGGRVHYSRRQIEEFLAANETARMRKR